MRYRFIITVLLAITLTAGIAASASATTYKATTINLPDIAKGQAMAINDNGWVVGYYYRTNARKVAFVWDGQTQHYIDTPSDCDAEAVDINNRGEVIGNTGIQTYGLGFRWTEESGTQSLGNPMPGFVGSNVQQINNTGIILGSMVWMNFGNPVARTITWNPDNQASEVPERNGYTLLMNDYEMMYIGNDSIIQNGIVRIDAVNNQYQLIGNHYASNWNHAFLWDSVNQSFTDLSSLAGNSGDSEAKAINDKGQVVGWSDALDAKQHAFVWDTINGMQDLGEGIAYGINEQGWIVGVSAGLPTIWQPVPEPSSILTLLCGAAGAGALGLRRRR